MLPFRREGQNSCTKHLKFLKKLLNLAVANSYILQSVNAYKVEREPVEVVLGWRRIEEDYQLWYSLPRLERAKDMFLLGASQRLSYIDIKTLTPEHFEKDNTGRIWIKKRRVKTGVLSRIPYSPSPNWYWISTKVERNYSPIQDPADINKYLKI